MTVAGAQPITLPVHPSSRLGRPSLARSPDPHVGDRPTARGGGRVGSDRP